MRESRYILQCVKKFLLWKSLLCVSCRHVQYICSLHSTFFRSDRDERLNQTIKQQKQHKNNMNNTQVAHLWASGNKANGKGSNFYFEGDTIFSYGNHFPIARRVNENLYLITERGYSVSTSKHISYTRRAIPGHARVFTVENRPDSSFETIRGEKWEQARKMLKNVEAKTNPLTYERARTLSFFCDETMELFGLFQTVDKDFICAQYQLELGKIKTACLALMNTHKEAFELAEAKKEAQREAREEKRRAKYARQAELERMEAEKLAPLWRAGEKFVYTWKFRNLPPMLRIIGDKVQTSHGAEVTIDDAKRAFSFIVAKINRGETWHRNGETCPVGPFSLVSIDSEFVTVGCHKFTVQEVLNFGKLIA